jgi:hypothetical protein
MSFATNACIAGIYEHPLRVAPDHTVAQLHAEVAHGALLDAGLTLNDVRVDFGTGAFAPGQVYVALSRVRSMAGLSLARPLRLSDFRTDPMLNAFMDWM